MTTKKETLPPLLSADDKKELHENVKKNLGHKDLKEVAYMCPTCWEIFDEFEVMRKHHKTAHGSSVGATKELYQCTRHLIEGDVDPIVLDGHVGNASYIPFNYPADYIPTLRPEETFTNLGGGRWELSTRTKAVMYYTGTDMNYGVPKPLTKLIFDEMRHNLNKL